MTQETTERKKHKWQLVLRIKGGHRYFTVSDYGGMVACADASGTYPEQTEDGILWLDRSRPIVLGDDNSATIPLKRPDGEECATGEYNQDAILVANAFGFEVVVQAGSTLCKLLTRLCETGVPIDTRSDLGHVVVKQDKG